jgi:hypothetical protein
VNLVLVCLPPQKLPDDLVSLLISKKPVFV